MKPAPFECRRPETREELRATLAEHGDAARLLAGGQSLVPMMNLRLARAEVLVDINRVGGLAEIRNEGEDLVLGAMLRQRELLEAPAVSEHAPLLVAACRHVGYPATRNRGTLGGSAAHADPAAELPAALLALEARFVARGAASSREIEAADFFVDYFTTALEVGEVLEAVRIPKPALGTRSVFLEVSRRKHDFPLCGVAAQLGLDAAGRCEEVRVALCSAAAVPVRAKGVETALRGSTPTPETIRGAAAEVDADIEPLDDVHGSAGYRRDLAETLTRRAIDALAREVAPGA